jgi:aspartyl-tRNA(Asn)/glutamyl-tRNA(Gln) amidotransferase subunit C
MTDVHARAKRLAELAGLTLRDGEIDALDRDLDRILGYVSALAEVDTTGVAPLASPNEAPSEPRDDTPERTTSAESVLASGPLTRDGAFVVPNVLE